MEDDEMEMTEANIEPDGANYMLMRVEIAEYLLNTNGKIHSLAMYLKDCEQKGISPDTKLCLKMIDIVRRFQGEPEEG